MRSFHRTDDRTWSLLDDQGAVLGSLVRTKWHGMGAEIVVAQGVYDVKGMKGLTSKLAVFSGDRPLRVASYRWDRITITDPQGSSPTITVGRKSVFSGTFLIKIGDQVHAQLRMRVSWKRFDMEPVLMADTDKEIDPLTLLFIIRALQVQQHRAAGAVV
jgi:hypothetical protein